MFACFAPCNSVVFTYQEWIYTVDGTHRCACVDLTRIGGFVPRRLVLCVCLLSVRAVTRDGRVAMISDGYPKDEPQESWLPGEIA